MIYNEILNAIPLNYYKRLCNSCIIYIILFVIFFILGISISSVFISFHWYLKKDNICVKFDTNTQTTIY